MDLETGRRKKGSAKPEMNVTPLVDVVLVLLIIFLVVTPMMAKNFWVAVPPRPDPTDEPPPNARQPAVLSVGSDGRIRINRDVITDHELPERLRRVLAAQGNRTIFFDAHNDAEYGRAVEVLDRARASGATTSAVVTEELVRD